MVTVVWAPSTMPPIATQPVALLFGVVPDAQAMHMVEPELDE
jgi:hypothetical protein